MFSSEETIIRSYSTFEIFFFRWIFNGLYFLFHKLQNQNKPLNLIHALPLGGGIQLVSVLEGKNKTSFIRHGWFIFSLIFSWNIKEKIPLWHF